MWKELLYPIGMGQNSFYSLNGEPDTLYLHTAAFGASGFDGIFDNKWFQGKWRPHEKLGQPGVSIVWQELFAMAVACQIWGTYLLINA